MGTIKTIKIAPSIDEVVLCGDELRTDWNGGIVYRADGLSQYEEESLKRAFCTGIALSSRPWQLERLMNDCLGLKGVVEMP